MYSSCTLWKQCWHSSSDAAFYSIWSGSTLFESPHDKTNKIDCVPGEDSDQPGHQSDLDLYCLQRCLVFMEYAYLLEYIWSFVKIYHSKEQLVRELLRITPGIGQDCVLIMGLSEKENLNLISFFFKLLYFLQQLQELQEVALEVCKNSPLPWRKWLNVPENLKKESRKR